MSSRQQANAQLMAAAPCLLAALLKALDNPADDSWVEQARAVIERAIGPASNDKP